MAIAYSSETNLVNHHGVLISVPRWVKRDLSRMRQLVWNRDFKLWQIKPTFLGLLPLFESAGFTPHPYRAQNYEGAGGRSKDSGYANKLLQALGRDMSGLNAPSRDEIRELSGSLDRTLTPAMARMQRQADAARVVREVKREHRGGMGA